MKRHLAYLKYVLRHKWFVFIASYKIKASLWRAIIHDMSKFLPSEWSPYVRTFYKPDGSKQYNESEEFNVAWNYHQKRNKHHYQYWILFCDDGREIPMKMPKKYVKEMAADWIGAGRACTGNWNHVKLWYEKRKDRIPIHNDTKIYIEKVIEEW